MRNQLQMFSFLSENVGSHHIISESNKIIAKPLFKSYSFVSFKITYMKNGSVSLNTRGVTKRYNSDDDIIRTIGSVASITEEVYKTACNNLAKEYHKENMEKFINNEPLNGYVYSDLLEIFNLKQKHINCYKRLLTVCKDVDINSLPEHAGAFEELKHAISFELMVI